MINIFGKLRDVPEFSIPLFEICKHLGVDARSNFGQGRSEIFQLKLSIQVNNYCTILLIFWTENWYLGK